LEYIIVFGTQYFANLAERALRIRSRKSLKW